MKSRHRIGSQAAVVITLIAAVTLAVGQWIDITNPPLIDDSVSQLGLENRKFSFNEKEANFMFCLHQFALSGCDVRVSYDSRHPQQWNFAFSRNGKDFASHAGTEHAVFRASDGRLFFAEFSPWDCGCTIVAYDIAAGQKLWERRLLAVGHVSHSAYGNQITLSTSRNAAGTDTVEVAGHETYGDYIEVMKAATGELLAHKTYRLGFH